MSENSDRLLRRIFFKKETDEGIFYYRKGYECLCDPNSKVIREDCLAIPDATLKATDGLLFIERIICPCYVLEDNWEDLVKMYELSEINFDNVRFERVIGIKTTDSDPLLYHTYSGTSLENLLLEAPVNAPNPEPLYVKNKPTPKHIASKIAEILAKGLSELHKNNILYHDPLPSFSYLRYDFGDKLIYSPHNCMLFKNPSDEEIGKELALVLYTHDYIRDKRKFLKTYIGGKVGTKKLEDFIDKKRIIYHLSHMEEMDDGPPLAKEWLERKKFNEFAKAGLDYSWYFFL